jgi:hypothetical protein
MAEEQRVDQSSGLVTISRQEAFHILAVMGTLADRLSCAMIFFDSETERMTNGYLLEAADEIMVRFRERLKELEKKSRSGWKTPLFG